MPLLGLPGQVKRIYRFEIFRTDWPMKGGPERPFRKAEGWAETEAAMSFRSVNLALLIFCPVLAAQEVRYIDLTAVEQHTQLRYPPSPDCPKNGACGGYGGGSISDGAPDIRDPHALGVYLTHRTETQIDPSQPFQVEFKVVNTGKAPIDVPVSPDLSDLQPVDDSVSFHYLSIALVVTVFEDPRSRAYVELYGSAHREQTIVTLQPGEWIRVTADAKLGTKPAPLDSGHLQGSFWLRQNTYYPSAGGSTTNIENLYPNLTRTPPLKVFWIGQTAAP